MSTQSFSAVMPWGEELVIRCDLEQANSPILVLSSDGEWAPTQFQVADARHRAHTAMMLAVRSLGRGWFALPDDRRCTEEILSEISEGIEVAEDQGE